MPETKGRRFPPSWPIRAAKLLTAKMLTKDEARWIAANFAKLPELLGGESQEEVKH